MQSVVSGEPAGLHLRAAQRPFCDPRSVGLRRRGWSRRALCYLDRPMDRPAEPYQVVARRFRPRRFTELVGQDGVVASLRSALQSGRIPHAFLFSGSRGVGKTTSARILARALNCETGPSADPCGSCDACRSRA